MISRKSEGNSAPSAFISEKNKMKDILTQILRWKSEGKPFAIARVIQTWGSSPRPVGSGLIISDTGEMAGSVSGGCVEGAVLKEAQKLIAQKIDKRLNYGVSDDEAWSVGLTCGGKVQVYLQVFPADHTEAWSEFLKSLEANKSCGLITSLTDGVSANTFIAQDGNRVGDPLPDDVVIKAREALVNRTCEVVTAGETQYFIHVIPRRSQMLIIGAAHITADLVLLAHLYDFETVVIDPRGVFATNTHFTQPPDKMVEQYPSEALQDFPLNANTYAVILSHDPKIDDDALLVLLKSKVAYIGALGSRKTHEKRVIRLKQEGFSDENINRIEAPIGVDIHAQGAKEIALSIMGAVIRRKNEGLRVKG